MNKTIYLAALILFAAGCKDDSSFKKTSTGLEYKIITGSGGQSIKYGDVLKFKAMAFYKDSALANPMDTLAQFVDMDSSRLPPDYLTIFEKMKKGDSVITRILVDSAMKHGQVPPFAKKGEYLSFRIRVIDVITDKAVADQEKNLAMQEMMKIDSLTKIKQAGIDDKILTDFLAKERINAVKTAKGTYVEVQNPGTGVAIDSGKVVTVNYIGKTLAGKIFDQSYDATGKPLHPFTFTIGQKGAIEGWDDGLRSFKKGGKGRLFIPSGLAYGTRGAGADIKPNDCLQFEIEVMDVK